jgi:NAD(P)H-dependent FMN reductase
MKISVICGSQRLNSQSKKVGLFLQNLLKNKNITTDFIELAALDMPFFLSSQSFTPEWKEKWAQVSSTLLDSEAFVIISPEWNGQATPIIKNFFNCLGKDELAHKPALLVSVSSGLGGAFVISELRASSQKNTLVNYIPEHLIIRQVEHILNQEVSSDALYAETDEYIRERSKFAISVLIKYANALQQVREGGLPLFSKSKFGMS